MQWKGTTLKQRKEAKKQWHEIFCLFPRQMDDGTWVWLEFVWARATFVSRKGYSFWEYSASVFEPRATERVLPTTPPKLRR